MTSPQLSFRDVLRRKQVKSSAQSPTKCHFYFGIVILNTWNRHFSEYCMPEFLLLANRKRRGQSGSPWRILRLIAKTIINNNTSYFNPKYGPIEKGWPKIEGIENLKKPSMIQRVKRFFKVHSNTNA